MRRVWYVSALLVCITGLGILFTHTPPTVTSIVLIDITEPHINVPPQKEVESWVLSNMAHLWNGVSIQIGTIREFPMGSFDAFTLDPVPMMNRNILVRKKQRAQLLHAVSESVTTIQGETKNRTHTALLQRLTESVRLIPPSSPTTIYVYSDFLENSLLLNTYSSVVQTEHVTATLDALLVSRQNLDTVTLWLVPQFASMNDYQHALPIILGIQQSFAHRGARVYVKTLE